MLCFDSSAPSHHDMSKKRIWNNLIYDSLHEKMKRTDQRFQCTFTQSYLDFIKNKVGDYIFIKHCAASTVSTEFIMDITIIHMLAPFLANAKLALSKDREEIIQYFGFVLKELLKTCEEDHESYIKNRIIFNVHISGGVEKGISQLVNCVRKVAGKWRINNYKVDSNCVEKLTLWAKKYLLEKDKLLKTKSPFQHTDKKNLNLLKKYNKEMDFYANVVFVCIGLFTLLALGSYQFLERESAVVLSIVSLLALTAIGLMASIGQMKAWQNRYKVIEGDYEKFNSSLIHFFIKQPKPENHYSLKITLEIKKMDNIDDSKWLLPEAPSKSQPAPLSKRLQKFLDKKPEVKPNPVAPIATARQPVTIIDPYHIEFMDKNGVTYDSYLTKKIPKEREPLFLNAFHKGLMPRGTGGKKPHSIVSAKGGNNPSPFKIRVDEPDRVWATIRFWTGPKKAIVDFNVYDPHAHDPKRQKMRN